MSSASVTPFEFLLLYLPRFVTKNSRGPGTFVERMIPGSKGITSYLQYRGPIDLNTSRIFGSQLGVNKQRYLKNSAESPEN